MNGERTGKSTCTTGIAIVGGGAAGAAIFGALLAQEAFDHVLWITGRQDDLGRGVAYGAARDHHLLNVRAKDMGLYIDADEDFARYGARHRPGSQPTDFLPRRMFGDYIQSQLSKRLRNAEQQGRCFTIAYSIATRLSAKGSGYEIMLDDGQIVMADRVVLALGSLPPRPLRAVSEDAIASAAYVLDPWSLTRRPLQPRRLIVIGTGLTAIDTILSASMRWPDVELIALSRHGLLPSAHPPLPVEPYPHQADLNAKLMACAGPASILAEIRRLLRENPAIDWRSIIDGMRPINARLWQALSLRQRRQFLRHIRWLWDSSRHRFPPGIGAIIQQLRDEGRLHVYAARVLKVDGTGPLNVSIRHRANQAVTTLQSDVVVQATGLDTAVSFAGHRLLGGLIQDGLAVADPLQLGLLARADGHLINTAGGIQPGLYAIGSLLQGNLWECVAMPEIHKAAHALAMQLNTHRPMRSMAIASN
ncbi:FAD/NAD(P)-binding protein [Dyella flagellata]|uniref:Pyridine nucleotide-disulfide oxidoreductase n=1 Tax=Dyella flagellata TaxID=1867833 RepID=A0ABQ5XBI8_9GAMM|nr:FAD/NAD(P)-binding protein [Dyella flagellata]GLQ88792.1 pyridine nucleotide-disulfide oxidoreductase [Dyella flagellata]